MPEKYTGEERRSVERDGTKFTKEQAKGAGKRVIEEEQTFDEAEFTEGDLMRNAIKGRLGVVSATNKPAEPAVTAGQSATAEPVATQESSETHEFSLEKFVKTAYPKARAGLLDGEKLCEPEQIPSEEEVLAKLKTLSKGKLEVVEEMKSRILILEPKGISYKKFIRNLDTGTTTRNKTAITASRRKQFDLQDKALGIKGDGKVTGWEFSIEEGAGELDDKSGILEDLTTEWKAEEQAKKGATLVDHVKMALIEKQAIMSGKRVDRTGWSVLSRRDNNNETVCEDKLVSGGDCCDSYDYVYFRVNVPHDLCYNARFRVAVTA